MEKNYDQKKTEVLEKFKLERLKILSAKLTRKHSEGNFS